jgi:hypothetical protein
VILKANVREKGMVVYTMGGEVVRAGEVSSLGVGGGGGGGVGGGVGGDYKSVKRTIELNDSFERKMMELVEENRRLEAEKGGLGEQLEFYWGLEERVEGGGGLQEFLESSLVVSRGFEEKLGRANEKYLKVSQKYNLLRAKHESVERKYLESEKQRKVLAEKNHTSKIESSHTTWAARDKDKVIRTLNEQMSTLHNEISRLKIENNNIRRDLTPKVRHNSTISSNNPSNPILSHMTNKSRSRAKLNASNKIYPPPPSNKHANPMPPSTPTHIHPTMSSLSINKENRNSQNTPSHTQDKPFSIQPNNWAHSRHSIPRPSEKNMSKDSSPSIFDNKILSNLETITENNAINMTTIYYNNLPPNQSTDTALLDPYKSKSSRSPILNKKPQRTLQKTPKAKSSKFSSNLSRNSSKILDQKDIENFDRQISPGDRAKDVGI